MAPKISDILHILRSLFKFSVFAVWGVLFIFIVFFLCYNRLDDKTSNNLATAFVATNVIWIVGLEITVRSKRSGKFLFRTYV